MRDYTRIDKALRLAQKVFFTTANGGRKNAAKIIIILTDGLQKQRKSTEDPSAVANDIRNTGIYTL